MNRQDENALRGSAYSCLTSGAKKVELLCTETRRQPHAFLCGSTLSACLLAPVCVHVTSIYGLQWVSCGGAGPGEVGLM